MTAEKGRLFSIGQFAALHGVNKKTLMWYDEIGLFCPAVVKENGNRYYTYFQSATLEAILLLRELDVPVARIRSFLDDRSAQSLAALWDEQLDAVDRKLARLRELRRTMQTHAHETRALLELDTGSVEIVTCPPERLMLLPTTREAGWEQDTRTLVSALHSRKLGNLYSAGYGAMLPVQSLLDGDYQDYRYVFLRLPASGGKRGEHEKPGGRYLRAYYRGNVNHVSERYPALLAFARGRGLSFTGYAYETVLHEMAAATSDACITRIELALAGGTGCQDGGSMVK